MSSSILACPSCSRPLDADAARDGELRCACGAVVEVASPEDHTLDHAAGADPTIDTPPAGTGGVEPVPAGFSSPFSADFLEQYVPVGFLGKGAMGAVYLMRQVKLDRLVAVKVVREDVLTADESRRLEREARVLASLNHPNILSLYDVGTDGRLPFMVCEYVEGETLLRRLQRRPALTLLQTLRIAMQVCDGLKAAHKKGIVHRDLKPGNIFLSASGRPKIGDFGLAKAQTVSSGTLVGKIMGTPAYMSPEQCRGSATTPSSDIYAVGVIIFEMATGKRPFPGPETLDYLTQHTTDPAPAARSVNANLPEALESILARALAKDPARRFDSARSFRKDLLELYKTLAPQAEAPTPKPAPKLPPARKGDLGAGALLSNRYRVLRQLGEGGMGQVWLASDEAIDGTEVALKILPPDLWRDAEARETLKQEAKLSQKLAHPHIVRLMTLEPGDPPFLVMEFVSGPTLAADLATRKRKGGTPYSPAEALPLLEGLASGLDHAHAKNLVHRDLKPSNVLLDPQADGSFVAKLADFGIAAELTNYRTRQTGAVPAGTLAYMSPEQLACQKLDGRADVYSLGATLYQMLCLRPPFVGGDIAWAIKNEPVPEPTGVPDPVITVLLEALAKKPDARPASAGALAARFREAVEALPAGPARQSSRPGLAGGESSPEDSSARGRRSPEYPPVSADSGAYARPWTAASGPSHAASGQYAEALTAGSAPDRRGPDMLEGKLDGVNPGSVRIPVFDPAVPWSVEAYALAFAGALALVAIWFHVGHLLDDRLTPARVAAQLLLLLALIGVPPALLWMGHEKARRGLAMAHWLLLPLAVVFGARGHVDLFAANLGMGLCGLWLLERPATLAFTTSVRPDDMDLREYHRRRFAVAVSVPLMIAAGLALKMHLQSLAPHAMPSIAWRQDPEGLAAYASLGGELKVQPPAGWLPGEWPAHEKETDRALAFVYRSGAASRVAALSVRVVRRSERDQPGDVRRAAERLGRMRHRWHFKLERAAVVPVKGVPWVECTGQYRTRAGWRSVYYVETTREGTGYEMEFYGLPAFMAANRALFSSVLASVELPQASGSRAAAPAGATGP